MEGSGLLKAFKSRPGVMGMGLSICAASGSLPEIVGSTLLLNVLSLAMPLVLMQVYDRIIPTRSGSTLLWLCVGYFTALGMESALRLCRSTVTNWLGARFEHALSQESLGRIMGAQMEDLERDSVGRHLDRLAAVGTLRSFYAGQLIQTLVDTPFVFLFLLAVAWLGGRSAFLLVVCASGAYLVLAYLTKRLALRYREEQITAESKRSNFTLETLAAIHTVKALTVEEQMLRRNERLQEGTSFANMAVTFLAGLPGSMGAFFSQTLLFGMTFVAGRAFMDGDITMGSLAACSLLAGRVFQPVQMVAGLWVRSSDMDLAAAKVAEVADLQPAVGEGAPALPAEIRGGLDLKKVRLADGTRADLALAPGEFVALASDDPLASSVLLELSMGLRQPEGGEVLVDGLALAEHDQSDLQGRLALVPQTVSLFAGTIFENVSLFDPRHREGARDAAALLGLDAFVSQLPLGYETQVGNRLHEILPTGVIQRIGLARALAVRPRILLLDRVEAAMDFDSKALYFWLLEKLKGHCTILAVTGEARVMALADRSFDLRRGRLVPRSDACVASEVA